MKDICPNCIKITELESIKGEEIIDIRGESIKVEVLYLRCCECGEEFDDPKSDDDPLERAFSEYRRQHGITQPEEIRAYRRKFGLTQSELSKLLGWGGSTLSRYENGALQDEAHEKQLRLVMDPKNLLNLVLESAHIFPKEKHNNLIRKLRSEEEVEYSFERIFKDRFGSYEPDIKSGYMRLKLSKLVNAIIFFSEEGIFTTLLNKLLFYADFKHYRDYAISITGARYAHLPHGPALDKYNILLGILADFGTLRVDEVIYRDNVSGMKYWAAGKPDLSVFSNSELEVLLEVKKYFKDFTAKSIRDFSHEEKGYGETQDGQLIPYYYAEHLRL